MFEMTEEEWKDDSMLDPEPPKKKLKLSLSQKMAEQSASEGLGLSRFALPVSEQEFSEAAKGVALSNTKKNNCWAEWMFNAWVDEQNKVNPGSVPTDLLSCHDPDTVCKYMRYFVLEVRSQDGNKYPPRTIRSILSGLNRILKESKAPFSILDKTNPCLHDCSLH